MTLSVENENSYHFLSMLIKEFEDAALASGRREGYLAVSNGTTYSADIILDAQDRSLNRVAESRAKLQREPVAPNESNINDGAVAGTPVESTPQPLVLVDEDIDLGSIFGGSNNPVANYLEECFGCSLRLKFDWQLKPLNLLGPINAFLDNLNAQLDKLLDRINPFELLQDLCWALNQLKTLCPQDIILLLASIKLLIKKYLLNMFSIKLDWTTLLGPLLQALVEALSDLFDNIFALLMAPLDCAVAGLNAANNLLKASESFAATVRGAGQQVDNFFSNIEQDGLGNTLIDDNTSGTLYKDVSWVQPDSVLKEDPLNYFNTGEGPSPLLGGNQGYDPGSLQVKTTLNPFKDEPLDAPPENTLRIPAGFQLTSQTTMATAIKDPNFGSSTFLEKIIIPVQEAIAWIRETYEKFMNALTSITGLVGGSLSISFDNLGILLFLADIISLIMLIYQLLKSNLNIKDWCSYLQENPSVLEAPLQRRYGADTSIQSRGIGEQAELAIYKGPTLVGVVNTCVNSRTPVNNNIINTWITELEKRGART